MQMIKFLAHIFSVSLLILCLLTLTFAVPQVQARGNDSFDSCFYDSPPPPADATPTEIEAAGTVSAVPYIQQAYVKASNTDGGDSFGTSMAVSGDTLVVGAKGEASKAKGVNGMQNDNSLASAGAVYVFVRSNSGWSQQAYLKSSAPNATDEFGAAVAISGDTIVVGAPNEDSNATGVNGNYYNNTGSNSGAVYVFTRTAGVWTQQAYIKASNTGNGDHFGASVSISDDTLVVGAPYEDSNATGINGNQADNSGTDSGVVYAFTRSGTTWSQQAYIKASNTGPSDAFGFSVSVAGNTIVAGAPKEDSNATGMNGDQSDNSLGDPGAVYAFVRNSNDVWTQQAYIKPSITSGYDQFGYAVAVSANTIVVGAPFYAHNPSYDDNIIGGAYVFNRTNGVWSEQGMLEAADANYNDRFGASVGISGNRVVIGAPLECDGSTGVNGLPFDNWSAPQSGAVYSFVRNDNIWQQQAYIKASNTNEGDQFGVAVAIYCNTLVSGASQEDSNATGVNGGQLDNSMGGAGAVYIFNYVPTVLSSLCASVNPTTASSVDFTVHFAEPMTGVDPSDFVPVTSSGITGMSVLGVSGGPSSYTVTVNTGQGDGTLRLDVKDDDSIRNAKNVPLGGVGVDNGNFVDGEIYLVRLRTKTFRSQGAQDGWVLESTETSNVGGSFDNTADTFRMGDDAANRQYISILDFDTSNLPETIVVTKAILKIKKQSLVGTDFCGSHPWLGVDLRIPFFGETAALAADDFNSAPSAHVASMHPPSSGDWYSSNVTYYYLNRTGSTQFKLSCYPSDNNDSSPDYLSFYSGDAATVADRPTLILQYYVPTPIVISSLPASASPTTASSVDFNVTFSEPMTGVDASDFVLVGSSQMSAASIVGVSGGPSSYTVTVNTSVGSGILRLDVKDDDSIRNAKNVPLGDVGVGSGDFSAGESYLVRPVTQIFRSQAAQDGWVLHVQGNPNFTRDSTANTFRLGDDATHQRYCSFLHFDTASLPESIVITKAMFKIKTQSVVGTNPFTKYELLYIDVAKPFFGSSPALENQDHFAGASIHWNTTVLSPSDGWYSFLIDSYIYAKEDFFNSVGSTQFRLQIPYPEDSPGYMAFYSGDAPTASDRPTLTVQYYIP